MTNPLKWLGWLFSPIAKNSAFFVFMFVLGWLCCQLEIMPYYLRNRGAQPYKLTVPELFLDLYMVCVVLTFLRALTARLPSFVFRLFLFILYFLLYSIAIVDVFCYVRFESTLTPTMLMLVAETSGQEAREFLAGYLSWDVLTSEVGWILLLMVVHLLWTLLRCWLNKVRQRMILPKARLSGCLGLCGGMVSV